MTDSLFTCKNRIGRRWLRGVPVDYETLLQKHKKELKDKLKADKKKCNCTICKQEREKYEKATEKIKD